MGTKDLNCPSWNNSKIYEGFADPKIQEQISTIKACIQSLVDGKEELNASSDPLDHVAQQVANKLKTEEVLANIMTFATLTLSVDSSCAEAKLLKSRAGQLYAELEKAYTPYEVFLLCCPEQELVSLLSRPEIKPITSDLHHKRKMTPYLLSAPEEALIKGFAKDGLRAWGELYQEVSSSLKVVVAGEKQGLADAANLVRQGDRRLREEAWRATNQVWQDRSETPAAILNAINGWRWEETRQRETRAGKKLHYLDQSCHRNKIDRGTLNTLMDVAYKQRDIGQRGIRSMAKCLGVERLAPWDLLAPPPMTSGSDPVPFPEAIKLIRSAFSTLSPEMGDFVQMMYENRWIDAASSENRRGGAFCSKFFTPREPRVFMTYGGQLSHILTLAHELGHAYHNWVMLDLPLPETRYSMCTAETASIFAETLVKDYLLSEAKADDGLKGVLWQEAESAAALLINIPARFEFEKNFVEKRAESSLPVKEISEEMSKAWAKFYEDSISEYDPMFWATKLHFSIADLAFYNYPYLFGYLFSLGVYAKKEDFGDDFHSKYVAILRDTGVMSAEELIQKHFDQDIRKPAFWEASLQTVNRAISKFEALLRA